MRRSPLGDRLTRGVRRDGQRLLDSDQLLRIERLYRRLVADLLHDLSQ